MDQFFKELWDLAKTAGPFGTVLMLWLYLRADNRAERLAKEKDAITKESNTGLNAVALALQSLREFVTRGDK